MRTILKIINKRMWGSKYVQIQTESQDPFSSWHTSLLYAIVVGRSSWKFFNVLVIIGFDSESRV